MRGKIDFLNDYCEYVESMIGSGLTEAELAQAIRTEAEEKNEELTDRDIGWLVDQIIEKDRIHE